MLFYLKKSLYNLTSAHLQVCVFIFFIYILLTTYLHVIYAGIVAFNCGLWLCRDRSVIGVLIKFFDCQTCDDIVSINLLVELKLLALGLSVNLGHAVLHCSEIINFVYLHLHYSTLKLI